MSTSAIAIPLPALSETPRSGRVKQTDRPHPPSEIEKLAEPVNELKQTLDRLPDRDDLQRIKGIGQAIAQALNSLGVHRYADLVNFTPDSLADLLKAEIPSISPKRIERDDWIGQAWALAQQGKSEHRVPEEEMEAEKDSQKASSPQRPKQDAVFMLFIDRPKDEHGEQAWQTRVYHDESGEETIFSGVETAPWVNWILERAGLPVAVEPIPTETKVAPPQVPATPYDAGVEILDVRVSEVPTPLGIQEKKLMAEVRFQVSGPEAKMLTTEHIPFRIEIYSFDLGKRASKLVASEEGELQPQVFEYPSQQEFPVPRLGRHKLHTIVLLLPPGEMMASHRGPTIKVVP